MIVHLRSKNDVRNIIRRQVGAMTIEKCRRESTTICRMLEEKIKNAPSLTIAVFLPLKDEPDIVPFIKKCFEKTNTICAPQWRESTMVFQRIESLDDLTANPATNIREPGDSLPPVDTASITLVLVPGRAFTPSGGRLGRGGGTYDRWIEEQRRRNPMTRFIGVCFRCQLIGSLPMEEHDQTVDEVVNG